MTTGCAMELPDPRLIIKHRVLAIRTEVTGALLPEDPELADRPKAEALPFETVTLDPFIVNADGPVDPESLDLVWIACQLTPGQGLFACLQDAMPLKLEDIPACESPGFADIDFSDFENLPEVDSPCVIGREGTPEYDVPISASVFISGSIELTMIGGVPDGTDTDTCARELLRGEFDLPNDCLFAVQRLNVGPLEQLALLAEMFGAEIPGLEAPDPEDVPEADRHPRISEIRVGSVNDEGEQVGNAQTIVSGDTVSFPLGATLQVEVDSPEEDLQTFLIPVNNGESFEERSEGYAGDWFLTWGLLLAGTSDDPSSYNQWTLEQGSQDEDERPPNDRARMYYVVRDGRQGVNWFWFEVEVTDP
ncbi:hypothetical protein PPSIR1_34307 [Plesiocystis pacifica SIR-1]|uniref:Uncharacterized protein n=2 Tax=Plesiocystis pacifica TaxID=191768 RepID=A6G7L9_9BACT|nr:hypothetical protein PPSIR1_34307 [Plesiocystis pacifica SIR-1]